ncbi:hypothetical protein KCH_43810 [Kitasatospora cheerisanensis KCTC 2395]|uniref:DUF2079 domain-containing protein n=1 Tax=Kitasatospora cheerisanensis KCTC 2395 TaxID=1348663 RepID=A0A066YRA4_9ACTN|nr:hypothetical protein KCH_43810 [Kitasatospora cheerisanensis KCTC 2395]
MQTPVVRATDRASGVRLTRRRRTVLLTLLSFAACLALGLQQWTSLQLGGFDLGIFDQGVRGYAHFRLPVSTLKSVHHEFPPGFSLLGDHFSPVLALLAPLYWVWDDPRMLLVGQAALFAAGVPLVRRIASRAFAGADARVRTRVLDVAALVYGLGWPLLISSRGGFHEVGFAVPLFLLLFERAGRGAGGGGAGGAAAVRDQGGPGARGRRVRRGGAVAGARRSGPPGEGVRLVAAGGRSAGQRGGDRLPDTGDGRGARLLLELHAAGRGRRRGAAERAGRSVAAGGVGVLQPVEADPARLAGAHHGRAAVPFGDLAGGAAAAGGADPVRQSEPLVDRPALRRVPVADPGHRRDRGPGRAVGGRPAPAGPPPGRHRRRAVAGRRGGARPVPPGRAVRVAAEGADGGAGPGGGADPGRGDGGGRQPGRAAPDQPHAGDAGRRHAARPGVRDPPLHPARLPVPARPGPGRVPRVPAGPRLPGALRPGRRHPAPAHRHRAGPRHPPARP